MTTVLPDPAATLAVVGGGLSLDSSGVSDKYGAADNVSAAGNVNNSGTGHRRGEAGYRRVTVAMFAAGLATFSVLYAPQPVLPLLASRFGVGADAATLTISLTTLALAATMLIAGPFSDVRGRTGLMKASLVASAVVSLACAAAPSWPVLLVLRTVQGVTLAGLPAVAMAYLREEVHLNDHGAATGAYVAGTAIGGMTGRLVAGGLADLAGWRAALAGVAVVALASAAAVQVVLPPSRGFVAMPAGPAVFWGRAVQVLRDPVQLALAGVGATTMGTFVAIYNALGFRLTAAPYGLSIAVAGLVFLVYPIGSVASATAGRLADRFSRRQVLPAGAVLMAAGIAVTLARPLWLVVLGVAMMTAGFFTAHGVASGWVALRAHAAGASAGQASAFYLLAYYLGSSIAGGFAGLAWDRGGWPVVAVMTLGLATAAFALAVALSRTRSLLPQR